jgi:hypothetical protein
LIKRREVYKMFKRKDDSIEDNTVNNISNILRKNNIEYINYELSDYDLDEVKVAIDHSSSRTRRLLNRKEGKKKDEKFWEDTCYLCGEHGNLICCEGCEHVAHFKCVGLKVLLV